jgi:hypothetical protein
MAGTVKRLLKSRGKAVTDEDANHTMTAKQLAGGVSNVDIDGNNTLHIKGIGVTISTFETLPTTGTGTDGTPVRCLPHR